MVDISLTDHSSFEIQCPTRFDLLETGAIQAVIHQHKRHRKRMTVLELLSFSEYCQSKLQIAQNKSLNPAVS